MHKGIVASITSMVMGRSPSPPRDAPVISSNRHVSGQPPRRPSARRWRRYEARERDRCSLLTPC